MNQTAQLTLALPNPLAAREVLFPGTDGHPCTTSRAVAAALRTYGLHWETMHQPTVAVAQSTPHPNHTWQMDASVCTLFYMDTDGTTDMLKGEFFLRQAAQAVQG